MCPQEYPARTYIYRQIRARGQNPWSGIWFLIEVLYSRGSFCFLLKCFFIPPYRKEGDSEFMNIIANEIGTEVSRWWRLNWHHWFFTPVIHRQRLDRLLFLPQLWAADLIPLTGTWGYLSPATSVCRAITNSENSEHWGRALAPKSPHWLKQVRIGLGKCRIERREGFSHSHLVQLPTVSFKLGIPWYCSVPTAHDWAQKVQLPLPFCFFQAISVQ